MNPLRAGGSVTDGSLLLEVAGAPLIVVQAPFSPYRDLIAGDQGRDVRVLKQALARVKVQFSSGDRLTSGDLARIQAYFTAAGYRLPTAAPEESPAPSTPQPGSAATQAATSDPVPVLPRTWWMGVDALPRTIASSGPRVGERLGETKAKIALTSAAPVLTARLPQGVGPITEGTPVTLQATGGKRYSWTLVSIGTTTTDGLTPLVVRPAVERAAVGASGRLILGETAPKPALAVPVTALDKDEQGHVVVRLSNADGSPGTAIRVTPGSQADGWVAITAHDGQLEPGTRVTLP